MSHTFQKSQDLFALAERSIAGGVNSGIRKLEKPVPLYFRSGKGCRLRDEDGNESINFQTGQGALLFGHAPDGLAEAIAAQARPGPPWHALARIGTHWHALGGPVPPRNRGGGAPAGDDSLRGADALQQLRHRGGELSVFRLVRAHTGRSIILKFEGHYHGWGDEGLVAAGRSAGDRARVVVCWHGASGLRHSRGARAG